jgi:ribosome-binding factor A
MGVREFSRAERVADQIQREVAEIISRDLADPRVADVTVSGARVSRDLSHATIYVTLHADSDVARTLEGLNSASGFLRRKLAERVRMRYLPRLHFAHDESFERAARVSALIETASREEGTPGSEPGDENETEKP